MNNDFYSFFFFAAAVVVVVHVSERVTFEVQTEIAVGSCIYAK